MSEEVDRNIEETQDAPVDAEAKDTALLMQQLMYLTNKRKTAEGWTEEDLELAIRIGAVTQSEDEENVQ